MTDLRREFSVSRKTGYKIFNGYKEHDLNARLLSGWSNDCLQARPSDFNLGQSFDSDCRHWLCAPDPMLPPAERRIQQGAWAGWGGGQDDNGPGVTNLPKGFRLYDRRGHYMQDAQGRLQLTPWYEKQVRNIQIDWVGVGLDLALIIGGSIYPLGTGPAAAGIFMSGGAAMLREGRQRRCC